MRCFQCIWHVWIETVYFVFEKQAFVGLILLKIICLQLKGIFSYFVDEPLLRSKELMVYNRLGDERRVH